MNNQMQTAFDIVDVTVKALIGVAVSLSLWFGKDMHGDIRILKDERVKQAVTDGQRDTRISVLEAQGRGIEYRLARIDEKLDALIARQK